MAKKYNSNANLASNWNIQVKGPLDTRQVVDKTTDLFEPDTFIGSDGNDYSYLGMLVSCSRTGAVFVLINEDTTKKESWVMLANAEATTAELDDLENRIETVENSLAGVYTFKGSVSTRTELPNTAKHGDVYNVIDTGMNYAWVQPTEQDLGFWDPLGSITLLEWE